MAGAQLESLGKRLRQERKKHHWTQGQLAEKIGVSESSIRRWENDRASLRSAERARLAKAFGKPLEQWGNADPLWKVPFPRNRYFTGRKRLLERLHQALAAEQAVEAQALSGLGGIGKTQTAIEYAYRYADEYEAVFWVRADSFETLLSDFADLAVVLDLPVQQERDQRYVVSLVKLWLEKHDSWLLIFDNADNPALVSNFLPGRGRGAVLLTTRAQATGPHIKTIPMGKMSNEEGISFLLHRMHADEDQRPSSTGIDPQEQEEARQLCEYMDGLPLALDQAAAYMEETGCTLSDFLDLFKTHGKLLLDRRGPTASDHPESVAATWLMVLQRVEHTRPAAAELLRFCAFLHPDAMPEAMIIAGASMLGPALQATAIDKSAWNEAIAELQKYSLVKRDGVKKILTMHRLMQAVIKDSMNQKALRKWAERVVRTVNATFPDPEPGSWPQCESLLPHALLAAQYIEEYHIPSEEAAGLLYEMASYLQARARYSEAEPFYQRALRIREQRSGREHLNVAASLDGLANLYRDRGKYGEAESLYQRALRIQEQQLGQGHLDVAISLEGLAILYKEQGKYGEAVRLHQRALAIREQQLGPGHLLVASSLNGLALLYKEQGRYAEAESLYQRSLAIREQQLGPEHPQVAASLNNLANLYMMQDKYAEAEVLHQRSLALSIQVYGEEHPETANSLNNLAVVYYEQGKYTEAVPRLQRALHLWEQHLGETHPHVAIALNNLAQLYTRQGEYAEAEPLYQQALHIWAQQLEPEHPDGAEPLDGLANLYREQGKYAEAEQLYQRALRIREQGQGAEHPETALIMYHLALLWEAQGNKEEAKTWYTRALAICERTLGRQHPQTTETRHHLIVLLRAMEMHEEAAELESVQSDP